MHVTKIVMINKDVCVSSTVWVRNVVNQMSDKDGSRFGYFEKCALSGSIQDGGKPDLSHARGSAVNHERRDVNNKVEGVNNYGEVMSGVDNKCDIVKYVI